jgi:competence protein ComEC
VALRIDTLAVGDGSCHLIRAGGEAMLWDCGSAHPGFGVQEIPRAVRELGAWRVRSALVTHPNLDHFVCLPDVVQRLGIERVWVTRALLDEAALHPAGATAALIRELQARRVVVRDIHAGESFALGPARCEILSPAQGRDWSEANDTSLVGLFSVDTAAGERRALMTGDLGPGAIVDLEERVPSLHADVMELPHHGSAKPESMRLVGEVDPAIVLQSTGPQRLGDARWDDVKAGRTWWITARDGAAWAEVRTDGELRSGAILGSPVNEDH